MAKVNHQNTKASDCEDLQILRASVILQEASAGPRGVGSVSCFQTITQHSNIASLCQGLEMLESLTLSTSVKREKEKYLKGQRDRGVVLRRDL